MKQTSETDFSKKETTTNQSTVPTPASIRQNSKYTQNDKPAPDNNIFWEDRHNPLSSKGD